MHKPQSKKYENNGKGKFKTNKTILKDRTALRFAALMMQLEKLVTKKVKK